MSKTSLVIMHPTNEVLLRFARHESNAAETEWVDRHLDECVGGDCENFLDAHEELEDPEEN